MITNTDVFHALKTLQVFCADHEETCSNCPLDDGGECFFEKLPIEFGDWGHLMPSAWDVESLHPILDPASATSDR